MTTQVIEGEHMASEARRPRRAIRLPEVVRKTGLGADSIYRLARSGHFPKPFKLSERASAWFEDEIDVWLEQRAASR